MIKFCIFVGFALLVEPGISNLTGVQLLPGHTSNLLKLAGVLLVVIGIISGLMRFLDLFLSGEDDD